jgi:hypothetical protein
LPLIETPHPHGVVGQTTRPVDLERAALRAITATPQ